MESLVIKIEKAAQRIAPYVLHTPLLKSDYLSQISGAEVFLKLESEQITGSFKLRGATNKVLSLSPQAFEKEVITASTGNHGLGFATAVKLRKNTKARVFVPKKASPDKINLIRSLGVAIEEHGSSSSEAEVYARSVAEANGLTWVSPYNDFDIIAGQGTIGVEILHDLPDPEAILVTVGGGGLISGIGTLIKNHSPSTQIIGCLPENSPEVYVGIKENRFVPSFNLDTISDGSAGGYEEDAITLDIIRKVVDNYVLVTEDEIKSAMRLIFDHHHKVIEGAAGVAVASFIKEKDKYKGKKVVIVICGANISREKYREILVG